MTTVRSLLLLAVLVGVCGCGHLPARNSPPSVLLPILHSGGFSAARYRKAFIALPPRTASGTIVVQVTGEVCSPGVVTLPEGGTVLEAINAAGGFTDFAMPYKHVEVRRSSEVAFLSLRDRKFRTDAGRSKFHVRHVVWYIATPRKQAAATLEIEESGATTDYVLLQNDIVFVPRCAAMLSKGSSQGGNAQPLRRANRRQPPRSFYFLRLFPAASCRSRRRSV